MKLFVVGDYVFDSPQPEVITPILVKMIRHISDGAVSNLNNWQWFANKPFFADNSGDMKSIYAKYNIFLRENKNFDMGGAILFINRLIFGKKIVLDERIGSLLYQMMEWSVSDGQPDDGNGLARALCLIASSLSESGYTQPQVKPWPEYAEHKAKFTDKARQLVKEGKESLIGKPEEIKVSPRNSWMVG
jgi:hypothetical protein